VEVPSFGSPRFFRHTWQPSLSILVSIVDVRYGAAPFDNTPDERDCDAADTPERGVAKLKAGWVHALAGSKSRILRSDQARCAAALGSVNSEHRRCLSSVHGCLPNSESETGPIATSSGATPPWAPAEPQRWALAMGHASVSWNRGTVDRPTAYSQFCQSSSTLRDRAAPTPSG
jgi:hypothetical protein